VLVDRVDTASSTEEKRQVFLNFSDELMDELGCEVDRIEYRIRELEDINILHIDLESHAPPARCPDHAKEVLQNKRESEAVEKEMKRREASKGEEDEDDYEAKI